jgi:hypothetical protein
LRTALDDNGGLRQEVLAISEDRANCELTIEYLLGRVAELDRARDLALTTGRGRFAAACLKFIAATIATAVASFSASAAGLVTADAAAVDPGSPTAHELVVGCEQLSDSWLAIPLESSPSRNYAK